MSRIYLLIVFVFSCAFYSNAQADIQFKEMGHDFGKVQAGKDTLWYNFVVTNTGNEPLLIQDIKTSCDCTLAQWPKTPIMPGRTAIVRGGFKIENKSGTFEKSLYIITNTSPATTILYLRGEIISGESTQ
ncbi:DUF1573 domain-containing protein [Cytophaga aurantiaca]|uniref:DUF1573 domain-containing protein n=1 Tax=Cytophaga aurantiaca TaxID=29530 RepID=UPI00036DF67C|nr:DUF1573 domain-containing protein [Cytophaga aurantiaca]